MERQEILTSSTISLTTVQSRISHSSGNYGTDVTKLTILFHRPIFSLSDVYQNTANQYTQDSKQTSAEIVLRTTIRKQQNSFFGNQKDQKPSKIFFSLKDINKPILKRSSDHFKFDSPPTKKLLKITSSRQVVATAHWQDSPLLDNQSFINSKLLEVSQAEFNTPRKYLHLAGGALHTGKHTPLQGRKSKVISPAIRKSIESTFLPPPPPLVSISGYTSNQRGQKQQLQSSSKISDTLLLQKQLLQSSNKRQINSAFRSNEEPLNCNTSRQLPSSLNLSTIKGKSHRYFMNDVGTSLFKPVDNSIKNTLINFSIGNRLPSNDQVVIKLYPPHLLPIRTDINAKKSTIQ